jgi:hypothetical protein
MRRLAAFFAVRAIIHKILRMIFQPLTRPPSSLASQPWRPPDKAAYGGGRRALGAPPTASAAFLGHQRHPPRTWPSSGLLWP